MTLMFTQDEFEMLLDALKAFNAAFVFDEFDPRLALVVKLETFIEPSIEKGE